jgi:hypothetical protein
MAHSGAYTEIQALLKGITVEQQQAEPTSTPPAYDFMNQSVTEKFQRMERGLASNTHIPPAESVEHYAQQVTPAKVRVQGTPNSSYSNRER